MNGTCSTCELDTIGDNTLLPGADCADPRWGTSSVSSGSGAGGGGGAQEGGAGGMAPGEDVPLCADHEYIALHTKPCDPDPLQDGWEVLSVFPGEGGKLASYCLHKYTGPDDKPDLEAYFNDKDQALAPGVTPTRNCRVFAPQGLNLSALRQGFLENVGADPISPEDTYPKAVRVMVADNSAGDPDNCDGSEHGCILARQIRSITCQPAETGDYGSCPVDVQLLPVVGGGAAGGGGTSPCHGGATGKPSEVACRLNQAHREWRASVLNYVSGNVSDRPPLNQIFNLSIGFETRYAPSSTSSPFPVREIECSEQPQDAASMAVVDAMRAAACYGSLIVTAVGNDSGGTTPAAGPVCPAGWASEPRPTGTDCSDLVGGSEWGQFVEGWRLLVQDYFRFVDPSMSPVTLPLQPVYLAENLALSVGAVDYSGTPLITSRPAACPDIWALGLGSPFGADAVSNGPALEVPLLSGSSVAAASVTGLIAARWLREEHAVQLGPVLWHGAIDAFVSSFGGPSWIQPNKISPCGNAVSPCPEDRLWIHGASVTVEQNPTELSDNTVTDPPPGYDTMKYNADARCPDKLPVCQRPTRSILGDVGTLPRASACLSCRLEVTESAMGPPKWVLYARVQDHMRNSIFTVWDVNNPASVYTLWLSDVPPMDSRGDYPDFPPPKQYNFTLSLPPTSIPLQRMRAALDGYDPTGYSERIPLLITSSPPSP